LPRSEYDRLEPSLALVSLSVRDLLFDVDQPIEYVYFPETCVASTIALMSDGSAVETATVGDEGMVGMAVFHGTDRTASQAFCQVPGDAIQLSVDDFRDALGRSPKFSEMLHLYAQALFTLVGQSSACNRLHMMRQRCARWLLHTHDRVGASRGVDEFPLTQQFLSQMLGVRRASVSEAMSMLQESGAVSYEMGSIEIVDRPRLEAHACECYRLVRSEFDRLLRDGQTVEAEPSPSPLAGLQLSVAGKTTVGDAVGDEDSN
jgi:CRP-like cAMP-binding protein